MEIDSKDPRKVIITEVPITYDLVHYTNVLKKAKEKGIIDKYLDYSEDDIFKFEVKLNPNYMNCSKDELMKHLGLVDTITEILTCIDENNSIAEPESVKEIFEAYYKIKINFLKKRIASEIKRLQDELDYNQEVYKFIMDVNKGNINIKLNKKDVEAKMKELKYKFTEKLIALPIYNLTKDKAAEAKQKVADKEVELEEMKKETPEDVWLKDLDALEAKLKKEGRYV
jgi:DNA topoisomerase-2